MKAKLLSITAAFIFIAMISGCKKETAGAKINLQLKSVNATTFSPTETVKFTFEFTPKSTEADTLFVVRKFYTCPYITRDTTIYKFPDFNNNNTKGELIYSFQYGSGGVAFSGCLNTANGFTRTDSLNYYFWVKDKDGNISDTIVSPKIILNK
jgi:hypothetical protein